MFGTLRSRVQHVQIIKRRILIQKHRQTFLIQCPRQDYRPRLRPRPCFSASLQTTLYTSSSTQLTLISCTVKNTLFLGPRTRFTRCRHTTTLGTMPGIVITKLNHRFAWNFAFSSRIHPSIHLYMLLNLTNTILIYQSLGFPILHETNQSTIPTRSSQFISNLHYLCLSIIYYMHRFIDLEMNHHSVGTFLFSFPLLRVTIFFQIK